MENKKQKMNKKLKVVKKLKLDEIYQIDEGFFYIAKQKIKDSIERDYYRYYLKVVASPQKMELLNKFLNKNVSHKKEKIK